MRRAHAISFLQVRRKPSTRIGLIPILFVAFFTLCAIVFQSVSSITAGSILISSLSHNSRIIQLGPIQLKSPIFQPPRTIREHVTTEDEEPLHQQLQRIRDVPNWRVLGDSHSTGEAIYKDKKTHRLLTKEANIAFFLQLSESNIIMGPRLLSRVWHPRNVYCIHFDTKIPVQQTDMFMLAVKSNPKLSNVFFLPSVPVTYTGISMILNTLESMHALLTVSKDWDYYINLSGSDYPLVSVTALRRLLGSPGVLDSSINFIHFDPQEGGWTQSLEHRFGTLHFDLSLGFNHESDEKLFETHLLPHPVLESKNLRIEVPKGAAWIIGHRKLCETSVHGDVARRLIALFANMQSTPEHFFQTLAWNDKQLNETAARHSFREIIWGFQGVSAGRHPYYLDNRASNGSWEMWEFLQHSGNFFARKFRVADSNLLDHIDIQKSGATDKQANMTAVSISFDIVKNRFSCVMDALDPAPGAGLMPCFWRRWKDRGCSQGQEELCVGDFAVPPV